MMAKKAEASTKGKSGAAVENTAPKTKKLLLVLLVIVVVVAISVAVDYSLRNPRVEDETAAMNQIFGQGVIANNPEITYDTVTTVNVLPLETINGKDYYPVEVITGEEPNTKLYGPYYVAIRNSKIFIKDTAGQLVPYGV